MEEVGVAQYLSGGRPGAGGSSGDSASCIAAAHDPASTCTGGAAQVVAALPLDVLAAIVKLDVRFLAAHVRPVCRDWRAAFDAVATRLTAVAPCGPGGSGHDVEPPCGGGHSRGDGSGASPDGGMDGGGGGEAGGVPSSGGGGGGSSGGGGGGALAGCGRRPLPLAFERLQHCVADAVPDGAALRRLVGALADGSPRLVSLSVVDSGRVAALPPDVARLTRLRRLAVNWTALAALPSGVGQLACLEVLDLSYNQLAQLPASIASLPRLTCLQADHNLLTELPPLPAGLARLDVSYNRLKSLDAAALGRLDTLTALAVVRAFSHPPCGEGGAVVGALARVAAARGGGAVAVRCDRAVAEQVRSRARLLLADSGACLRVVGDG
ncbi:MAG: hypothetical protein J3K34DRAFT_268736 [Monoraphidium minutum]|nr:MAG: hypothetical protein J3K34DRAFT_268736 [Monoraphidium minutum]